MSLLQNSNAISTGGYDLTDSVRFRSSASASLERTPTTTGNQKTFTASFWIKRGLIVDNVIMSSGETGDGDADLLQFHLSNQSLRLATATTQLCLTNAVLRDPSSWYHVVLAVDTTQATASNRIKIYLNNVLLSFSASSMPAQNTNFGWNKASNRMKIARAYNDTGHFDGYMTEVNFVDGQALTPSDFGETDAVTGVWKPKKYTGTYGTNGFYLPMKPTTQAEGFNTVLYTGTGATQSITGVGFTPDLVWIKNRVSTPSHRLFDSVRGTQHVLHSNLTNAESTSEAGLTAFDSDGFTLGSHSGANTNNNAHVAWCWDAGSGSPVSNTDGTITSTVKANTAKGFSVVSWNAPTSGACTVGHGLGVAPKMIIAKIRNVATNWPVWHTGLSGGTYTLFLNSTGAQQVQADSFGSIPTSDVLNIGSDFSGSGRQNIAYVFAEVAGYSKFGSYTGNGTSQSINLGFRPAFVMWKRIDAGTNSWIIKDNTRYADNQGNLFPNATTAENTDTSVTFTDTGFDVDSALGYNGSGRVFIYMAFADTRDYQWDFDASGNKNNWTPNNINSNASSETTYDIMSDVPTLTDEDTANFCTMSPIDSQSQITLSEGNLKVRANATAAGYKVRGTQQLAGKIYFEGTVGAVGGNIGSWFGIADNSNSITAFNSSRRNGFYYNAVDMRKMVDGAVTVIGSGAATAGDIIGLAYDLDGNTFSIYKNNVALLTNQAFTNDTNFVPIADIYRNDATDTGFTLNFGQRPFAYTPPAGYKKLNTYNLPDSSIKDGSQYFDTKLWAGNGGTQSITGVEFSPDFVWIKSRTDGGSHTLQDSVRGVGSTTKLSTNSTNAENNTAADATDSRYGYITALNSDGFTVYVGTTPSQTNKSGQNYVGWSWRGSDSAAVSNTNGTITSTVSANTTAGFSILTYTGNGTAGATVGHGLSQAPDMVVVKQRGAAGTNWAVYHKELTDASYYMWLNLTSGQAIGTNIWNSTDPTTSVFSIGTSSNTNTSAGTYIAYCFHSVEGYSKFGSYTGNASTNGVFVYTGFRPVFVLVKNSTTGGLSWVINDTSRDTYNECNKDLITNSSSAESSPSPGRMDILSNGFKIRSSANSVNQSGANHIYMAFAENPFKNSLAR